MVAVEAITGSMNLGFNLGLILLAVATYYVMKSKLPDLVKSIFMTLPIIAVAAYVIGVRFSGMIAEMLSMSVAKSIVNGITGVGIIVLLLLFRKWKLCWMYYFSVFCMSILIVYINFFAQPM